MENELRVPYDGTLVSSACLIKSVFVQEEVIDGSTLRIACQNPIVDFPGDIFIAIDLPGVFEGL